MLQLSKCMYILEIIIKTYNYQSSIHDKNYD